jgi:SAM-dependent methyltransferase
VNANHERLCPSPEWARYMQEEVLPSVVEGADLGEDMLEIGPGPGAATDWLRRRVARLTAVEIDAAAAERLKGKFGGTNVHVAVGDATSLDYADGSFDSVGSFTMLRRRRRARRRGLVRAAHDGSRAGRRVLPRRLRL